MTTRFESVLMMADATGNRLEEGLRAASRAHRDPEFERAINARRVELAVLPTAGLEERAERCHFREWPATRALLIEHVAAHEVSHELTIARAEQL